MSSTKVSSISVPCLGTESRLNPSAPAFFPSSCRAPELIVGNFGFKNDRLLYGETFPGFHAYSSLHMGVIQNPSLQTGGYAVSPPFRAQYRRNGQDCTVRNGTVKSLPVQPELGPCDHVIPGRDMSLVSRVTPSPPSAFRGAQSHHSVVLGAPLDVPSANLGGQTSPPFVYHCASSTTQWNVNAPEFVPMAHRINKGKQHQEHHAPTSTVGGMIVQFGNLPSVGIETEQDSSVELPSAVAIPIVRPASLQSRTRATTGEKTRQRSPAVQRGVNTDHTHICQKRVVTQCIHCAKIEDTSSALSPEDPTDAASHIDGREPETDALSETPLLVETEEQQQNEAPVVPPDTILVEEANDDDHHDVIPTSPLPPVYEVVIESTVVEDVVVDSQVSQEPPTQPPSDKTDTLPTTPTPTNVTTSVTVIDTPMAAQTVADTTLPVVRRQVRRGDEISWADRCRRVASTPVDRDTSVESPVKKSILRRVESLKALSTTNKTSMESPASTEADSNGGDESPTTDRMSSETSTTPQQKCTKIMGRYRKAAEAGAAIPDPKSSVDRVSEQTPTTSSPVEISPTNRRRAIGGVSQPQSPSRRPTNMVMKGPTSTHGIRTRQDGFTTEIIARCSQSPSSRARTPKQTPSNRMATSSEEQNSDGWMKVKERPAGRGFTKVRSRNFPTRPMSSVPTRTNSAAFNPQLTHADQQATTPRQPASNITVSPRANSRTSTGPSPRDELPRGGALKWVNRRSELITKSPLESPKPTLSIPVGHTQETVSTAATSTSTIPTRPEQQPQHVENSEKLPQVTPKPSEAHATTAKPVTPPKPKLWLQAAKRSLRKTDSAPLGGPQSPIENNNKPQPSTTTPLTSSSSQGSLTEPTAKTSTAPSTRVASPVAVTSSPPSDTARAAVATSVSPSGPSTTSITENASTSTSSKSPKGSLYLLAARASQPAPTNEAPAAKPVQAAKAKVVAPSVAEVAKPDGQPTQQHELATLVSRPIQIEVEIQSSSCEVDETPLPVYVPPPVEVKETVETPPPVVTPPATAPKKADNLPLTSIVSYPPSPKVTYNEPNRVVPNNVVPSATTKPAMMMSGSELASSAISTSGNVWIPYNPPASPRPPVVEPLGLPLTSAETPLNTIPKASSSCMFPKCEISRQQHIVWRVAVLLAVRDFDECRKVPLWSDELMTFISCMNSMEENMMNETSSMTHHSSIMGGLDSKLSSQRRLLGRSLQMGGGGMKNSASLMELQHVWKTTPFTANEDSPFTRNMTTRIDRSNSSNLMGGGGAATSGTNMNLLSLKSMHHYGSMDSNHGAGGHGGFLRNHTQFTPTSAATQIKVEADEWSKQQDVEKASGDQHKLSVRKLRSLLNRLSIENFDAILAQIVPIAISNEEIMRSCVGLIFEKACNQHKYIDMYTTLCLQLSNNVTNNGQPESPGGGNATEDASFKKLILRSCHEHFNEYMEAVYIPDAEAGEEEQFEAYLKFKNRLKGCVMFAGTLSRMKLLNWKAIAQMMQMIIESKKPHHLEALAVLLPSVHGIIGNSTNKKGVDALTGLVAETARLSENPEVDFRIRCLLNDGVEKRVSSVKVDAPTTLENVRREAEMDTMLNHTVSMWNSSSSPFQNSKQQQPRDFGRLTTAQY